MSITLLLLSFMFAIVFGIWVAIENGIDLAKCKTLHLRFYYECDTNHHGRCGNFDVQCNKNQEWIELIMSKQNVANECI